MKKNKFISGILALCLCIPMVSSISETLHVNGFSAGVDIADDAVTIDGLIYEINNAFVILEGIEDKNATSITIPSTVDDLPVAVSFPNLFHCYPFLEEINLENPEEALYSSVDGVLFSKDLTTLLIYPQGKMDVSYSIPEGTISVDETAFQHAKKLKSVTIPESLEEIGRHAFTGCTALEEVIGAVPTQYGCLFTECSSLKKIEFADPIDPDSPEIKEFCISGCTSLEELIVPESRRIDGTVMIYTCFSLKTLTLPGLDDHSLEIIGCKSLQTLDLSDIELLGDVKISSCENLQMLKLPKVDFALRITACPNLNRLDIDEADWISITDCPELTEMNCFTNNCILQNVENADNLIVYGLEEFDKEEHNFVRSSCETNGIPYVVRESIKGDINGDTVINILDVITINRVVLGKELLTDAQNQAADVDGNGEVNAVDSLLLLKYIVGLIDSFNVQ